MHIIGGALLSSRWAHSLSFKHGSRLDRQYLTQLKLGTFVFFHAWLGVRSAAMCTYSSGLRPALKPQRYSMTASTTNLLAHVLSFNPIIEFYGLDAEISGGF